jgi:hypothetical protein
VARVALRFRVQGTFRADDYFAILAFVFLTALAAVVTRESPIFEMTQTYELPAAVDPSTPLPLPADEYISRTTTALKLMFAYGTRRPRILRFSDSSQSNALILVHPLGRLVILEPLQRNYYNPQVSNNLIIGKFSLLVFFRQMVVGIPKYMYIWWAVFTLVLLTYLASMLSNFLTCVPLQKYWSASKLLQSSNLHLNRPLLQLAVRIRVI